jgi:hypothetical protein
MGVRTQPPGDNGKILLPPLHIKSVKCTSKAARHKTGHSQRLNRGIALPIHDLGTRRGCVVSITPGLL